MTGPQLRSLACPNCGAPVNVRAVGITLTVVCGNCGSSLDAADPDLAVLKQSVAAASRARIPLGTRGWLAGIEWEAIGYLERTGGGGHWDETLLFNPWAGFRFLVHADGEWRSGAALAAPPVDEGRDVVLDGERFWVGEGYDASVDFVVGEFYWRVTTGETVSVIDYADASGATLTREANGSEVSWTRLELQGDGVVENAFGLQPLTDDARASAYGEQAAPIYTSFIAMFATFLLLLISVLGPTEKRLAETLLMVTPDGPVLTETTGAVKLRRWRNIVAVTSRANLDNAWVDLDFALVNRTTQQRFEAYSVVEAYSGRDSDGYWREGNGSQTVHFASLPRGTYDLIVEASAHGWPVRGYWDPAPAFAAPPVPVNITASRDGQVPGNLLLALVLVWAFPALQWLFYFNSSND